jgi:hypothetical protein
LLDGVHKNFASFGRGFFGGAVHAQNVKSSTNRPCPMAAAILCRRCSNCFGSKILMAAFLKNPSNRPVRLIALPVPICKSFFQPGNDLVVAQFAALSQNKVGWQSRRAKRISY